MIKHIVILICALSLCADGHSQFKQFSLQDSVVNVGDSCIIYPSFDMCHWVIRDLCIETILLCDSIRKFLNNNDAVSVEIRTFSDYRGGIGFTDTITLMRSVAIRKEVLYKSNIDGSRIIASGYGNRMPLKITEAINNKYKFLPIGQSLTKDFIKSLPSIEEQEEAHYLNRRTDIKIIKKN